MAERQKIGGYRCEFVGPVPEELLCKSCKLVPKKLFTTDCCEEHFCQACINPVLKDKKPCPNCGEADFSTFFIKGAQKKILALQVHCAMKQRGCEWVGQLEQLDAHLDTDCQYVDVENEVEMKEALKKQEEKHQQNLEEKDQQIRELQESHKQVQQQLQEKDAELKQELQKKDEAMKALKDDLNQELKKRNDELKQELTKRDDELKLKLEEKEQQVRESAAEVTALKKQLQETDQKFSKDINALNIAAGVPPYHLTVVNYAELKGQDTRWDSECFYTHPGGYQCCIGVRPNGWREGRGTHVAVELRSAAGRFDGTLPWPAKATFTLQLLNQYRDQDHVTVTKTFEWWKPSGYHCIGFFSRTFVRHAELGWNAETQTKYLHDDSLRFRMAKIELHK